MEKMNQFGKSVTAMSTLGFYGGFRFAVYSADVKERAHVHAEKDNRKVKFWLLPEVELFQPNGAKCQFTPKEVRDCKRIINLHKQEFLNKFYKILESSGGSNSSSQRKSGHVISRITRKYLPIVKDFYRILPKECIQYVINDDDENGCHFVFFPNKNGIEPWLEVCLFRGQQHVHFEIVLNTGYKHFFEYEEFVSPENKEEILRNILKYVLLVYDGTKY